MRKLFAVLLILALVLALPLTAFGAGEEPYEGTYEGERDAKGRRSGYGTWTYHNFLYEGNWKNDMPNGEGTLYSYEIYLDMEDNPLFYKFVVKGNFIDGVADGTVEYSTIWLSDEGDTVYVSTETREVTMGSEYAEPDIKYIVGSVPPWGDPVVDSSLPAPSPDFEYVPTWAEIMNTKLSAGVYEGEYDAGGQRSGYGTWGLHNYLYAGHWENGKPNGEGTLYYREVSRNPKSTEVERQWSSIIHGNWVDGFADGSVDYQELRKEVTADIDETSIFRLENVQNGRYESNQPVAALNTRAMRSFEDEFFGVPPWITDFTASTDSTVDTPWDLYEKYPTGKVPYIPLKMENTGMGISPGNITNHPGNTIGYDIAKLGDSIFIGNTRATKKGSVSTIYKMQADGSQMVKLYEVGENNTTEDFLPELQVVGDWLYINGAGKLGVNTRIDIPYKMRADDVELSLAEEGHIWGLVVDDWEYEVWIDDPTSFNIRKTKLDYTERIEIGSFTIDPKILKATMQGPKIVSVSGDWVYVYISNDGDYYSIPQSDVISQIIKVKNDGSRQVRTYSFRGGIVNPYQMNGMPQIVGDRMYYMESHSVDANGIEANWKAGNPDRLIDRVESSLYSVDLDFASSPITVIPRSENQHITCFHVTENSIYYGVVAKGTGQGAIMRADLDGGNPKVLAGGFETGHTKLMSGLKNTGNLERMLIAADWMMFAEYPTKGKTTWYLMRLNGSDLHKLGEPFIPSNAPGITDSTGNWRYDLLEDGSAVILGAGSRLKQTGKLSIPATVDGFDVTAIGENAFYGCEDFTGVTIPKSVTRIGDFAFFWCKGLTGVTIPEGVTHIGEGAFQWCTKIKKVTLPASLTSVGSGAFANCPTVKLSVAKKNEVFEIVDGALFDRLQNRFVD